MEKLTGVKLHATNSVLLSFEKYLIAKEQVGKVKPCTSSPLLYFWILFSLILKISYDP